MIWANVRAWLQNYWISILGGLGLIVLGMIGTLLVTSAWLEDRSEFEVIAEWNSSIKRLGIEPVFPPEEDIYVGDVLAVITDDRRDRPDNKGPKKPLLYRAIKLHSEPMGKELTKYYASSPVFPKTQVKPEGFSKAWEQDPNAKGVFTSGDARQFLPLAVFPGFSFRIERTASAGLSGWGALLGGSRRDTESTELEIPLAETYGIPSLVAERILDDLCNGEELRRACSDDGLRTQLANVAGRIDAKGVNPQTGQVYYLVDVELHFVNRVYLARSIEQKGNRGRKGDASTSYENQSDAKSSSASPGADAKSSSASPGGKATKEFDAESSLTLHLPPFQRPVVFGYRAIKRQFKYNLDSDASRKPEDDGK